MDIEIITFSAYRHARDKRVLAKLGLAFRTAEDALAAAHVIFSIPKA